MVTLSYKKAKLTQLHFQGLLVTVVFLPKTSANSGFMRMTAKTKIFLSKMKLISDLRITNESP